MELNQVVQKRGHSQCNQEGSRVTDLLETDN